MNPSDENKAKTPPSSTTRSKVLPAFFVFILVAVIGGILFYYNTRPKLPVEGLLESLDIAAKDQRLSNEHSGVTYGSHEGNSSSTENGASPDPSGTEQSQAVAQFENLPETPKDTMPETTGISSTAAAKNEVTVCSKPTQQLNDFYKHLDQQPYMADYELSSSSQEHFTSLVKKLLANPPQVSRESDDLYTILKNTAHFFRVSGKDNIFMMKGILDKEKGNLEQILADYYSLVTTPVCSQTPYANGIDNKALYEYACFFLNTMGGRLYLFRRDSQSRMVVTYYAILLVDQANIQQNNRHGISLKPSVDMLIAEMEAGGSSLKKSDLYLDMLYDLKEKYQ